MGYRIDTFKANEQRNNAHKETMIEWLHEFSEEVMILGHQEGMTTYEEKERNTKAIVLFHELEQSK
jgi:flagellar biosynthesis/type III secretory pathway protein FliH